MGIARSIRIVEGIQAIKIRFSNTTKWTNEAFLPRAEHHISVSLFLSFSRFLLATPSCWSDAAANKKGREVIEKVEQPPSLVCTCRGACRLYRCARPRDSHGHLDMLSQGISYTFLDKAISPVLFVSSNIVFQFANL